MIVRPGWPIQVLAVIAALVLELQTVIEPAGYSLFRSR